MEHENSSQVREYQYSEIEELKEPLLRILELISEDVEKGAYSLIIGDDTSGRIPTLALGRVIKNIYELENHTQPEIRFLAGSRTLDGERKDEKKEKIEEYLSSVKRGIEQKKEKSFSKVLVVTDTIATGHSLDPLVEVLNAMKIDYDVVTVGAFLARYNQIQEIADRWGRGFVLGSEDVPTIYLNKRLSGVRKYEEDLFSTSQKTKISEMFTDVSDSDMLKIKLE